MAPFDSDIDPTGNLTTKISTLIDGQLPDFRGVFKAEYYHFS